MMILQVISASKLLYLRFKTIIQCFTFLLNYSHNHNTNSKTQKPLQVVSNLNPTIVSILAVQICILFGSNRY